MDAAFLERFINEDESATLEFERDQVSRAFETQGCFICG